MEVNMQSLLYDITLAVCDTTAGYVIKKMLNDFPTAIETKICSKKLCPRYKNTKNNIMFLTYQVNSGNLFEGLQTFINNRILSENTKCIEDCISTINIELSTIHLFIDILFWEGKKINKFNQKMNLYHGEKRLLVNYSMPQLIYLIKN